MKLLLPNVAVGLFVAGCAPTLVPHTPYIPTIRDRGQAEMRISTGFNGTEVQAGYQVTDQLVVHTALLSYGRPGTGKGFRSAEAGLGYYYRSPNGAWRLGGHGGLAYGAGTSGSQECFECLGPGSEYRVRYTYAYIQPTVLVAPGNGVWGFGLRVGRAYYHRLDQLRADTLGGPIRTTQFAGRQATFLQPTFQFSRQLWPWLALSSSFGVQKFLGRSDQPANLNPFVGQVGLHFVLNSKGMPRP